MSSVRTHGSHVARGHVVYLLGSTLFAINGTVSKSILIAGIDPARLAQLRSTAAFVILFAIVAVTNRSALRLRRAELPGLLFYGVLGITMTQYLYFIAIAHLPVGIALILEFTAPLMVALWMRFAWHYPTRPQVWFGLLLALAGLALIGRVWEGFALNAVGVVAGFAAAAALAAFYLGGDRLLRVERPRDPLSLLMWGFGASTLFWALVQPWWDFPWSGFDGTGHVLGGEGPAANMWLLAGWMVVLGTVLPFWLVLSAQRVLRASQAATIGMVEPIIAGLVAWFALGEVLTAAEIAGAVIVLAGVTLAERQPRRNEAGPGSPH